MTDGLKKACEETFPGILAIITPLHPLTAFKIEIAVTDITNDTLEDFESKLMVQGFFIADLHRQPGEKPLMTANVRKMEAGTDTELLKDSLKVELWQATNSLLSTIHGIQHFYARIVNVPDLMHCYQRKAVVALKKGTAIDVAANAYRCYTHLVNPGDVIRVDKKAFIVLPNQSGAAIHDISSIFNTTFNVT
ncbi:MAG: hypothetical protein ACFFD4_00855 [Candidatus Odinarchaeota archaeon]